MSEQARSLDESWRQIEDACRPIAQAWRGNSTAALGGQEQKYEALIKDAAKTASELKTPTQALALYRCYSDTSPPTEDGDESAVKVKALILDALADIITTSEARSISDMQARIDFIERASSNDRVAACARSLRGDLYDLCRRMTW